MDTITYNCIIIDTYTDIYPILRLVAGRVLTLIHLAAKDNFEDTRLVVVIVITPCNALKLKEKDFSQRRAKSSLSS